MRQPNDRSQSKRMAWKKVVDIIPSNFSQTRILSDDKYAVAQRKVLIRIVGNRHIKRSVSDRGACRSRDDPPNMASLQSHISTRKGRLRGTSCKLGLANCQSNSSTRKYASEPAP